MLPLTAAAQSHMIGLGPSRVLDTYISQEKYSGIGLTYLYIREGKKPGKHWQNNFEHEIDLSKTKDRTNTTSMLEGNYNLYWGRYRQWLLCDNRLKLQAGGLANVNLGFLYDMSTSNNPAQARFALNLMPAGIATYGFDIKQQHFSLRDLQSRQLRPQHRTHHLRQCAKLPPVAHARLAGLREMGHPHRLLRQLPASCR